MLSRIDVQFVNLLTVQIHYMFYLLQDGQTALYLAFTLGRYELTEVRWWNVTYAGQWTSCWVLLYIVSVIFVCDLSYMLLINSSVIVAAGHSQGFGIRNLSVLSLCQQVYHYFVVLCKSIVHMSGALRCI